MNKNIECMISIVERGKNEVLVEVLKSHGCFPHLQFIANGTASSELLDLLGFGTGKRDVVISIGEAETVHLLMEELKQRERVQIPSKGIIFTISVNGISALLAKTAYKIANTEGVKEQPMETKESLILVSLNQGYSEEVMETAKKYGAKGGTIFKANWTDAKRLEESYGISLNKEKEILAIVASNDIKKDIMNHIHEEHGLDTKVQALVLSLPVNDKVIL